MFNYSLNLISYEILSLFNSLILSCTFAQAQITLPQDKVKPKFSLELNTSVRNYNLTSGGSRKRAALELNLGMALKQNRSLYLGIGRHSQFRKYVRMGVMQDVIVRDRISLGVGVGLRLHHLDYGLLSQGQSTEIQFELPIQAEFKITDRVSVAGSMRSILTLDSIDENYNFSSKGSGFKTEMSLGVKYRFSGDKKSKK